MEMIRDRNHSSHTYHMEIATAIISRVINTYLHVYQDLKEKFEGLAQKRKT